MIASTAFGIAAAVFVFSTGGAFQLASKPDDPLGYTGFTLGIYLLLVAISAAIMYAVASGRLF
jgi:hypothetical protein